MWPDLRVYNPVFLLARGSLTFFPTLVCLCSNFGFSSSPMLSDLAQACWGPLCRCLVEEVFLPSSSLGIVPHLEASIHDLYGHGPGADKLYLLAKNPH